MKRPLLLPVGLLLLLGATRLCSQTPAAVAAFDTYTAQVESRLANQHRTPDAFLALNSTNRARLRAGTPLIENLTPPTQRSEVLIHHWRATAFIPSATPADFDRLLRDFSAYPQKFAPDIVSSTVLTRTPTDTLLRLRTRQHHFITVILDTTCDVSFAALDPAHHYSISRSTRIDEITPGGDNGFLYRLNTYWAWEQRDGGLYIQLESLSLTRSIPHGLAWAVRPNLESIPRDSLIFTLTSARNALRSNASLLTPNP